MSDDREAILSRVRSALAPLTERAPLPDYDTEIAVMRGLLVNHDPLAVFAERLKLVGGQMLTETAALVAHLRASGWMHGYCDPVLWPRLAPHFGADFQVELEFDRTRIDDYAFGITRATGAIAEMGTIILDDATSSRRLGALTPWVHIAVFSRAQLFSDLPQAVAAMSKDPNIVWCTGPSKSADIEGVLIEGMHGPGQEIALVLD